MTYIINLFTPNDGSLSYQKEFDALKEFGLCCNNKDFSITVNASLDSHYDFLVFYGNHHHVDIVTHLPKERCIFMTTEPPNIKTYNMTFLKQFGCLATPFKNVYKEHPNLLYTNICLNWAWYFAESHTPQSQKPKNSHARISVVTSSKISMITHIKRIKFVYYLKKYLGDRIDVYGRGFRDMQNKNIAFDHYDYHIVIENSLYSSHWTEKISHPFYMKCFPFYIGCSNLSDYFPKESFVMLNINKPKEAVKIIQKTLDNRLHEKNKKYCVQAYKTLTKDYTLDKAIIKIVKHVLEQEKHKSTPILEVDKKTHIKAIYTGKLIKMLEKQFIKMVLYPYGRLYRNRLKKLIIKENNQV